MYWGGMLPKRFLKIRCSDKKQNRKLPHGSQSIVSKFWLSIYVFTKPADIKFTLRVWSYKMMREGTAVGQTASGVTDGEIVSAEYRKYVRRASSYYNSRLL